MYFGSKLKGMRNQLNLTQQELADRCELTKGYISQLENDFTSPSIATLCDILTALGSNLAEFFSDETNNQIVFTKNDYIEKDSDGTVLKWLVPNSQKNLMEPIIIEISPQCSTAKDFPHDGEEFGYVLSGKISVALGKHRYVCNSGDTFYFKSDKVHYLINKEAEPAKVIWISGPPNF